MSDETKPSKLLAEWFWTDRWMGSSAFLLPLEPRGLYREMLTQAWRRGGRLPGEHEAIRRAVGCTAAEWRRAWPQIEKYWRVDGDELVNDTQLTVYADARAAQERASSRGRAGAQARAQALAQARREQLPKDEPPSPSPIDLPERAPEDRTPRARTGSGVMAGALPREHLRHAFCGRVCVHESLHANFIRKLGGSVGEASTALSGFYAATLAAIPEDQRIGDDDFDFWRKHFAAAYPSAAPLGAARGARGPAHTTADVDKYAGVTVRDDDAE